VKLLRTIRLDPSDTFVFAAAAEPGEWAVSGAFAFWNADIAALTGKTRAAFRSGLLGVDTLGRSTLAQVVDASESDREEATALLAQRLVEAFGAPDLATARAAAAEEIGFAASLCDHPAGTLVAVHRWTEDGAVREQFRTLKRREGATSHPRAFAFLEVEGEDEAPEETVDLAVLADRKG
jgi:hypothetical protein